MVINIGSYVRLATRGALEPLVIVHLVVMALVLLLFARIGYHHWLSFRAETMRKLDSPVPARLIVLALMSVLYFLGLFALLGASWGDGVPDVIDGRSVWMRADRVIRVLRPGEAHDYATQELASSPQGGWRSHSWMLLRAMLWNAAFKVCDR